MSKHTFQINVLHQNEFLQTYFEVYANSSEEAYKKAEEYGAAQFGIDFLEAIEITGAA